MELAKKLLNEQGYTCVLHQDGHILTATERGVKPLVRWLSENAQVQGYCAADKVVGKATAYLYCLLGVKAVYAQVMSTAAMDVLRSQGIEVRCGKEVPGIINRRGDGPCPFEAAVWTITDPREALDAIHRKQEEMGIR